MALELSKLTHLRYLFRIAAPILDNAGRIIAICAGSPDDPAWDALRQDAAAEMEAVRSHCIFSNDAINHRRGLFLALAVGISFGGGQRVSWLFYSLPPQAMINVLQVPGSLVNNAANAAALYSLLNHTAFVRIAGFASGECPPASSICLEYLCP